MIRYCGGWWADESTSQIDEDMTARVSMADAKFSFQCPGRMYSPAWMAPEGIRIEMG